VEQRRFTRVESINFVNIEWTDERGQLTSAHVARTLDLSPGGVKIEISAHVARTLDLSPGGVKIEITSSLPLLRISCRADVVGHRACGSA